MAAGRPGDRRDRCAELLLALAEYRLLYSDEPYLTAYYDTLAYLAASLVGAAAGAAVGLVARRRTA